jgi:TRAP-type C4-dicarboxylate transport system permease large subunit
VGFNLFVLQGMTKKEITYLAWHALPMFLLMAAAILLIYFVPGIVTWLPGQMVG